MIFKFRPKQIVKKGMAKDCGDNDLRNADFEVNVAENESTNGNAMQPLNSCNCEPENIESSPEGGVTCSPVLCEDHTTSGVGSPCSNENVDSAAQKFTATLTPDSNTETDRPIAGNKEEYCSRYYHLSKKAYCTSVRKYIIIK